MGVFEFGQSAAIDAAATGYSAYKTYQGVKATNEANKEINRHVNKSNRHIAREANRFNESQAQKQMDFQERMSSTSYQRSMEDMRKAGLNPILAYAQGGASTPGGSSASATSIPAQGYKVENEMGSAVASALEARRVMAEVRNMHEQNKKIKSDADLNKALTEAARKDADLKANTAKSIEYKLPGLKNTADFDSTPGGKYLGWAQRVMAPMLDIIKNLK